MEAPSLLDTCWMQREADLDAAALKFSLALHFGLFSGRPTR
jgi:hypothetical protein